MTFLIGFFVFILIFFFFWLLFRALSTPQLSTFTLFFGPPRCGKTMFLTKLAYKYRSKKPVFCNFQILLRNCYVFDKSYIGKYAFPERSICLFDEGSLNGFDNRNFKSNFNDQRMLEYFKLAGHYKNMFVFSNQGWNELDVKIRTLTTSYYLVRRLPIFSIAFRVTASVGVDKDTHQIVDAYKMPNLLRILFDPSAVYLVLRSKYGKFYNSWQRPDLPDILKKEWFIHGKEK